MHLKCDSEEDTTDLLECHFPAQSRLSQGNRHHRQCDFVHVFIFQLGRE